MVTRNFSLQDLPSSYRLLSVPDEDELEFLTLEELKPHHLSDLGAVQAVDQNPPTEHQLTDDYNQSLHLIEEEYNVYYDLNTQQPK